LHLCSIHGSLDCLLFLLKFKNIDPNKKDIHDKLPLDYLIENFNHYNERNREMFLGLAKKTNNEIISNNNMLLRMNSWQMNEYENNIEVKKINMMCV